MSTVTRPKAIEDASPRRPVGSVDAKRRGDADRDPRGRWEVYDILSDAVGEGSHVRMAYDGKDLEIMTIGRIHEYFKDLFGQFVTTSATS